MLKDFVKGTGCFFTLFLNYESLNNLNAPITRGFRKAFIQTKKMIISFITLALILLLPYAVFTQARPGFKIDSALNSYNVSWTVPGPTSSQSMPVGNGDIGLNVWVEANGDLAFYIGKTDAWSENNYGADGLLKLGLVRVSLSPRPTLTSFLQVLKLHEGEIQIKEGSTTLRVWVDANNPVIRVEVKSNQPVSAKVTLDNWRNAPKGDISADSVLQGFKNRIVWYHHNSIKSNIHVANLTFGAVITGKNLVTSGTNTLLSIVSATSQLISVYPLTMKSPSPDQWLSKVNKLVANGEALNLEKTRVKHQQWWNQFWHRSWIFINGDSAAITVNRGYVLQRFITACAGRGAYPIKFNGSIFNVDNPVYRVSKKPFISINADYRTWGGQYWFQNTRAMYWPRLMAGDFDMMLPLFRMYRSMLTDNEAQVKKYYGHEGAYFAETAPFWGGLKYWGPEVPRDWTGHYFTPIFELSMMMLDYYQYKGDKKFAKEILLPIASEGITFFDKHFPRDQQGKILLDSVNSIETYWKVHDPAPDIAGLHAILPRLIALPDDLVDKAIHLRWEKMFGELPELPVGMNKETQVLLPYTGGQTEKSRNTENPELYAVYPFRLYGMGKPGLDLAINTFNARKFRQKGCWMPDPIQAAMLGLAPEAKEYITYSFNLKDPQLKFPAFWAPTNDYQPDQDNGGNGENGLQQMIMQCEGKKILLLPAWPKEWDAQFKLNAPYRTTVEGKIEHGKLTWLKVVPAEREADVTDMSIASKIVH